AHQGLATPSPLSGLWGSLHALSASVVNEATAKPSAHFIRLTCRRERYLDHSHGFFACHEIFSGVEANSPYQTAVVTRGSPVSASWLGPGSLVPDRSRASCPQCCGQSRATKSDSPRPVVLPP